jgi:predicted transposase/invertase (TIGR01784 family)
MKAESDSDWPKGVYLLAKHLKTGIIVIHQLPTDKDTLWIRLLGRGKVQKKAIAEVMALEESKQKLTILELLGNWKIMLDQKQEKLRAEERELIMNLSPAYLEWREKTLREGEQRGIQQGIQIGQQQGIQQVARNLLQAGMDPNQISHLTGLSLEVIQHLQDNGSNP